MHMRTKKWARPELNACAYFTNDCESHRGSWRSCFPKDQPLWVELGCGKGLSTAQMVHDNQDINFVVLDITCDVLGDTRRNIEKAFAGEPVKNVMIARHDIAYIRNIFSAEDAFSRIIINFCNPWTKHGKHAKRRLTHPRQLMQYRDFLTENGEIWFKTDDIPLFTESLPYFRESGFEMTFMTNDLHRDGFTPNFISEHEARFSAMGVPIKFGIFRKKAERPELDPTRYRLPDGFHRNLPEFRDYGAEE